MTTIAEAPAGQPTMKTFSDAEVRLAEALPGYESREPQQRLAATVEAVYGYEPNFVTPVEDREPRHLIAQAGCGTGKSLGYLIPAILAAVNDGRRTIVSVTTKSLQDQLALKDLPFLEQHLGVPFSWTVLKGRSNYFCTARAEIADESQVPMLGDLLRLSREPGFDGTREGFGIEVPTGAWMQICSDAEECKANDCKDRGDCFAQIARERAKACSIVVVNHALMFTDLSIKALTNGETSMLDEYDLVVFDEAHEAEEVAANTLGSQFSEGSLRGLTGEVRNWGDRFADEGMEQFLGVNSAVLGAASRLFERLEAGRLRANHVDDLADEFGAVFDALGALRETFVEARYDNSGDPRAKRRRAAIMRRINSTTERFGEIIAADWTGTVRWVEVDRTARGDVRKVIRTAPVDVSPFLRRWLFSEVPTVLVSATLAVEGKFDYIASRLGIDAFGGLDVGTPFNFREQARLYIPKHLPEPVRHNVQVWETQATEEIVDLVRASEGRALVLFTSTKHMRDTFASVARRVPYTVKMQGQAGETNKSLASWFAEDTHGVLFGTRSFFTGVDFQGETLSLVVIAKMPFPVPTEPMVEARCEALEAKGINSFGGYTMPVMSLVLQQAAGRLIRHRDDKGVVAILDPRIITKGYGKKILRDLPPMPQATTLDEVQGYFASLKG